MVLGLHFALVKGLGLGFVHLVVLLVFPPNFFFKLEIKFSVGGRGMGGVFPP